MPSDPSSRPFDIVLFGATGFTGGLAAEYLAEHAPPDCRWALAGRSLSKLEHVRDRLASSDPRHSGIELLEADAADAAALSRIAESARVVITTVGPYLEHGEGLVAACAASGTDYVDLTGEPEFVDRMFLAHNDAAVRSGARIVHACGFDSIPHDLGVLFTVEHLPADVPVEVYGVVRTSGAFSGGTLHSALGQLSRMGSMRRAAAERKEREAKPAGRKVALRGAAPRRDRRLDVWLVPMPTIDPEVVRRSALARSDYGPDFSYSHFAGARRATTVVGAIAGFAAALAAVQVPAIRRAIGKRNPQGEGPSQERRGKSWFSVDFIGEGGGEVVHTRVSGGDPGYSETSKMIVEAALCLAFDENPPSAGQVTTAAAMGEKLIGRLQAAGIAFEVIEGDAERAS